MHGTDTRKRLGVIAAVLGMAPLAAQGQLIPWRVFADQQSTSVCDLVNAANVEAVVLLNSRRLVLVTGTDTELVNTEVLNSGEVLIDGDSFGFIEFATDADGFRTLWWVSLTGRAMQVDGLTGLPSESNLFPQDFANVPCDACPFWDDGSICTCITDSDCDDFDECTVDECDPLGGCDHVPVFCADNDACTEDICDPVEGCLFVAIVCNDNDPCTDDVCDARLGCLFVEDDCDDGNPCTDEVCIDGVCVVSDNTRACNDGNRCTTNDRCRNGECVGTPVANCDTGGGGGPVFVICGNSVAMAMGLTLFGLFSTVAIRRRYAPAHSRQERGE